MKRAITEYRSLLHSVHPLLVSLLVLSVVGMNLLANKSIHTGVSWLALDCGLLLSWLCFLCMDIMTQAYGPRAASLMALTALGMNLLMVFFFFLASRVPGEWGESYVAGSEAIINAALDHTFGGTWFVLLGSSVAFAVSALLNNFLNYDIGRHLGRGGFRTFAVRAYASTALAQFADNLVFALMVSKVFFGWSLLQCFTCALTGALMELLFEVVFSPLGYRLSRAAVDRPYVQEA